MKSLGKYWGYLALIVLISAWWLSEVGPVFLVVLSVAVTFYFLFQAPVWCGAMTRQNQFCRNNSSGLLLGCANRQHKWQKLKLTVVPPKWRELTRGLWTNPSTCLATVATVIGILSTGAALVKTVVA